MRLPSTLRLVVGLTIIISYLIVLVVYVPTIMDVSSKVNSRYDAISKQSAVHTTILSTSFNVNSSEVLVSKDVRIGLNFTYSSPLLAANIPVNLTGVCYLKNINIINSSSPKSVQEIAYGFQNCLQYPITLDQDNLPLWGCLDFGFYLGGNVITIKGDPNNPYDVVSFGERDSTNITWSLEGDYKPIIAVYYTDGTNQTFSSDDIVIHVYPEQQLTEIQTEKISLDANQASLQLSWVVLILSGFTILALVVQVWDVKDTPEDTKGKEKQTEEKKPMADVDK